MKLSTEIGSAARIVGYEKAIEFVAKAGFDCFDFTLIDEVVFDWKNYTSEINRNNPITAGGISYVKKLKNVALSNGITCNQSHAVFPVDVKLNRDLIKKDLEYSAEMGAKICVVHPLNSGTLSENVEFYNEILPCAKNFGIKIATENMFNWNAKIDVADMATCATPESFNDLLNAVNSDYLVACVDLGHGEIMGSLTSTEKIIREIKRGKVQAIHIHDNDKHYDLHQIPFSQKIDYIPILKALKDVGYKGDFTLEADRFLCGREKEEVLDGLIKMKNSAEKLAKTFENL